MSWIPLWLSLISPSAWATVDDGRLLRAVGIDRAGRFILEVRGLYPEMQKVCEAHQGGEVVASASGPAAQPCAALLGLDADEITPVVTSPQCVALAPGAFTQRYLVAKVRTYAAPGGRVVHTVVHQHEVVGRMWDGFDHAVVSSPADGATEDCAALRRRLNAGQIERAIESLAAAGADPAQRAATRASLEKQAAETDGTFQTRSLPDEGG